MAKLTFRCVIGSPASRAVLYVAEQLGLNLRIENMELHSMTEEQMQLNPTRATVLEDGETYIFGSGAIMIYMVEKYGETDELYPKDLVRRAKVNSMIFFETQFLFGRLRAAGEPFFETFKQQSLGDYLFDKVYDSLDRLERILLYSGTNFIADNSITICDFSCIATIVSIEMFIKFDAENYPMITQWQNRLYSKFPEMEMIEKQNAHDFKILLEEVIEMGKLLDSEQTKAI